ncbi:MAG: DUF1570 domain-containing protein [Planctomycetota bacterium]|jgi:hypothetical protein
MLRQAVTAGLATVVCCAVSARATAPPHDAGVVHTSKRYELTTYGDISADDAAEMLELAEQLHDTLVKHFRAKPVLRRNQPRLQIRMWATRDGFRTNALADGVPEHLLGSGGVYWTGTRRAYFFRQPSPYATRHLWLHELTHQFHYHAVLGNGRHAIPSWYMEGIAEYFAYHHWDGKQLVCGRSDIICLEKRIPQMTAKARSGAFDPIAILAGTAQSDYGSAWALVHYFLQGADPATRKLFRALEPKIWKGAPKASSPKTLGRGKPEELGQRILAWTARPHTTWKIDWTSWAAAGDWAGDGAIDGHSKVVGLLRTHGRTKDPAAPVRIEARVEIAGGRAGVCAGYHSTKQFVAFDCTAAGKARLVQRRNGTWHTVAHATVKPGPRPVLALVVAADGTCTAAVNGAQVIQKKLEGVDGRGALALLVDGGRSRFSKIVLPELTHD